MKTALIMLLQGLIFCGIVGLVWLAFQPLVWLFPPR